MGLFVAVAMTSSPLLAFLLAAILILMWGNYLLPLILFLCIDISFVDHRELANLYGFILTITTIIMALILHPLRKFLKF
jgi:hypothetical protein